MREEQLEKLLRNEGVISLTHSKVSQLWVSDSWLTELWALTQPDVLPDEQNYVTHMDRLGDFQLIPEACMLIRSINFLATNAKNSSQSTQKRLLKLVVSPSFRLCLVSEAETKIMFFCWNMSGGVSSTLSRRSLHLL